MTLVTLWQKQILVEDSEERDREQEHFVGLFYF